MRVEIPAWIFQPCVRIASSPSRFAIVWGACALALLAGFYWQDSIFSDIGTVASSAIGIILGCVVGGLLALFIRIHTGNLKKPPSK
jgi:hypothetical protein